MTEYTLLYITAVATAINALAWVFVLLFGLRIYREMCKLREEFASEVKEALGEVIPLLREVRLTVGGVRHLTESGGRIAEQVASAIVLRRISPQWLPKKGALKIGVSAAREGLSLLRRWLHSRREITEPRERIEVDVTE